MQFLKQLIVLLLISFSLQKLQAQVTSADAMANKIFTTLKAKDEKAYIALYPNKEQMSRLMTKMMKGIMSEVAKSPEAMQELKDEGKGNIDSLISAELQKKASPEEMTKMEEKYAKDFYKIIEQGEKKGINWNTIELVKFDIDTVTVADESMKKLFGSNEFRSMKGVMHFKANDSAYQMNFDDVMYLPEESGWFGVKFKQLISEGEKFEKEDEEKEEVMVMEDGDEVAPPPPPLPPSKSKAKTKTTTSKTKTKTKTKS